MMSLYPPSTAKHSSMTNISNQQMIKNQQVVRNQIHVVVLPFNIFTSTICIRFCNFSKCLWWYYLLRRRWEGTGPRGRLGSDQRWDWPWWCCRPRPDNKDQHNECQNAAHQQLNATSTMSKRTALTWRAYDYTLWKGMLQKRGVNFTAWACTHSDVPDLMPSEPSQHVNNGGKYAGFVFWATTN